jgi:hypothetical protein
MLPFLLLYFVVIFFVNDYNDKKNWMTTAATMWTTVPFSTDHKHTRKQRKAKIFTASRSAADIPKINFFGILEKKFFNAY